LFEQMRRRITTCIAALCVLALSAAVALGQDVPEAPTYDDAATLSEQPGPVGEAVPDTDYTPEYGGKDAKTWVQVEGARFSRAADEEKAQATVGFATSYDDNLFDVSFRNEKVGLAGGAQCEDSDPDLTREEDVERAGCVPVLYEFRDSPDDDGVWSRVALPGGVGDRDGDERPGFVGAIGWIDADRALVVGGDGIYPRREVAYDEDCTSDDDPVAPWNVKCDPAGMARVWLYEAGEWCELKEEGPNGRCPALPGDNSKTEWDDSMRALTAVDFKDPAFRTATESQPAEPELGFAGGLGQLWKWGQRKDGSVGFVKLIDSHSPPQDLADNVQPNPSQPWSGRSFPRTAEDFRFRVRDLRFSPQPGTLARAVTSGCCTDPDTAATRAATGLDQATVLSYFDGIQATGSYDRPGDQPESDQWLMGWARQSGERTGAPDQIAVDEEPESLYSVTVTSTPPNATGQPTPSDQQTFALLSTTADPGPAREGSSNVWACDSARAAGWTPDKLRSPFNGTARLLSIDGRGGKDCKNGPNWAVGELRTDAVERRGRHGLVYCPPQTTLPECGKPPAQNTGYPTELYCVPGGLPLKYCQPGPEPVETQRAVVDGEYRPTDEERLRQSQAALPRLVSSYTLNSIDMVEPRGLPSGEGWAVGDHGAILQLAAEDGEAGGRTKGEPDQPGLSDGEAQLSPSGPFDALRPVGVAGPGQVPALAGRPVEELPERQMVSVGSPDATHTPVRANANANAGYDDTEDVAQIVMSRDGSEGWAIGSNPHLPDHREQRPEGYGRLSLYRFDGVEWRRCDASGLEGGWDPDPDCAGVAELVGDPSVDFSAATRIPYENDGPDEPDNDDDFEILALMRGERMARFKDGRWTIDESLRPILAELKGLPNQGLSAVELVDVAFTAPDDGWVLARQGLVTTWEYRLLHWDGEVWSLCDQDAACGSERMLVDPTTDGQVVGLEAAGDRVYMYGWRTATNPLGASATDTLLDAASSIGNTLKSQTSNGQRYTPLILYRDRGEGVWTGGPGEGGDGGGYDPGFVPEGGDPKVQTTQGKVVALSVVEKPGGGYRGWAVGRFHDYVLPPDLGGTNYEHPGYADQYQQGASSYTEPSAVALRLDQEGGEGSWGYFNDPGALEDFMSPPRQFHTDSSQNYRPQTEPALMATLGNGRSLVAQRKSGMLFGFEPGRGRFEVVQSGRPGFEPSGRRSAAYPVEVNGVYQALAPDGRGGFWAAVKNSYEDDQHAGGGLWGVGGQVFFYHYTDRAPEPVFDEVAHPLGGTPERLTALAGSADGSVWAGTDAGRVARYDRLTGWETLPIPGWEPGAVVTRRSEVNAVAVNDQGVGVAVGPKGRLANLSPTGVRLDRAATRRCDGATGEPCGTGFDLGAAAVSPDGAALAAGDGLTVLYRPAGREFSRVARPGGAQEDKIVAVSLPSAGRAYLVSDSGFMYAGRLTDAGWIWEKDNADAKGEVVIPEDYNGAELRLRAIAVDGDGHGYAVGDKGLILERTPHGWERVRGPGTDNLLSVTLSENGEGVLIGGENGVVWSLVEDRFEIARPGDYARPGGGGAPPAVLTGAIVGVALLPGLVDGQVEAWAASQAFAGGTNRLFHYTSDPNEPLLSPAGRAEALPDAPASRPGEVAFAAFGNTDCDLRQICVARRGTLSRYEVIGERIVEELRERFREPGEGFALFTGDATFTAGMPASSTARSERTGSYEANTFAEAIPPRTDPYGLSETALAPVAQRQWNRTIADPLERAGLAVYATPGPGDLSRPLYNCDPGLAVITSGCGAVFEEAKTGDNLSWRAEMGVRRAPWGAPDSEPAGDTGRLSFEPVEGSRDGAQEVAEQRVDPDGEAGPLPEYRVGGGARTHYAVDVSRDGAKVARLVVVDTSLRSLQGSDPVQQPVEPDGQLQWLERMICEKGTATTAGLGCSREPTQRAIVLTSTPTYSYGTTSPTEINATDGIQLEALLLKHNASVVVSGRLGWNTRYWATAPGVHCPAPGGAYQDTPPVGAGGCAGEAAGGVPAGAGGAAQALQALGAPAAPELPQEVSDTTRQATDDTTGVLPFVVAGGGGGPLGTSAAEESQQRPSTGYWNGYTVVRLDPSGNPAGTIVEQRPVFDWVNLSAQTHVLRPGQKLTLKGVGREPVGYGAKVTTRFDELNTAAITHRYDLVMADPEKPYLPLEDANGDYVPVPAQVATVDRTTGALRAGKGRGERTYTIALLSVGDKAATWPIVFEPRRSFVAQRAKVTLPAIPRAARAPQAQPPLRLADTPPPPAPPPATPPGTPLTTQSLQAPAPPELPSLPTINAAAPPPAPSLNAPPPPPPPPAPPPTPPQQQPLPLSLGAKLQAVAIVPSVNPPAPPPVNPAPPGGAAARKEAKQKQAAVAKSEEGESADKAGVDLAQGTNTPEGVQATRRAQDKPMPATRRATDRPTPSFSPLVAHEQASAWTRGALYGGGLGLAALAFSAAWLIGRPRSRRRTPDVPAPAFSRVRQR
jgi:hypothetical protein